MKKTYLFGDALGQPGELDALLGVQLRKRHVQYLKEERVVSLR